MTHIAGVPLMIRDRFCRQRCSWCGEILLDHDLQRLASLDGLGPGSYEVGGLVQVDGNYSSLVGTFADKLPADCCAVLEAERP